MPPLNSDDGFGFEMADVPDDLVVNDVGAVAGGGPADTVVSGGGLQSVAGRYHRRASDEDVGMRLVVFRSRRDTHVTVGSAVNAFLRQPGSHRSILPEIRGVHLDQAAGETDLSNALHSYAFAARRPGLAILISDLFSPSGYQEGLSTLLARGYEVTLLHVLSPEEANPRLAGYLKLVDVESGQEQAVSIDAGMRALYRQRLASWQDEHNRWCGQRGVAYVPVVTDTPFDELILYHLRRRGLVR